MNGKWEVMKRDMVNKRKRKIMFDIKIKIKRKKYIDEASVVSLALRNKSARNFRVSW